VTSAIRTQGNPDRHVVLRGGRGQANHHPADVARAATLVQGQDVARPVMIDCSHGNSGKDPARQLRVCREVLEQVHAGQEALMGLLLESNLLPGRQDWTPSAPLAYGVSITDACLGWEDTDRLLREVAAAVAAKTG
jgi:3-deoxy-7-phosphoheptulonate synthase